MASESKRKTNKQSTITFTLPLSCQICLGKVKQPVLCPNHHVFCQLCMDIWLERNKQCPTCRVEINDANPVKSIIGGQLEEEDIKQQSSADLRRARFELLYKEYEDQFDKMRKETIILRTENNILLAQLQDAENKNGEQDRSGKETSVSSSTNEPNLLMLTKNLQEAQTLYAGIKEEMTQLKQENSKLKDENVNLTRENEHLRLEIAQRSPKKFGRYTVATLETKLSEYEKEIRQLKKALERSDEYIEGLEKQIDKLSQTGQGHDSNNSMKIIPTLKETLHSGMNGHMNGNDERASNFKDDKGRKLGTETPPVSHGGNAKRFLFGPSTSKEVVLVNSKTESQNGNNEKSVKYPDSIMKHGEKVHAQSDNDIPNVHEKLSKTKRVHFDVPKSVNSSSFELEMPSPHGNAKRGESDKSGERRSTNESLDEVDGDPSSLSQFDRHVVSLLKKVQASKGENLPRTDLDNKGSKNTNSAPDLENEYDDDNNDSSRLSVPNFDSPRKPPSLDSDISSGPGDKLGFLDDETGNGKTRRTELDISMTPEMSDCLRLMNQAERKLEMSPTGISSNSSSRFDSKSFQLTNTISRTAPPAYSTALKPQHSAQAFSSAESLKGWEQNFFRGLHANPYKPYKFTSSFSSHATVYSNDKNNQLDKGMITSSVDRYSPMASLNDNFTNSKVSALSYSSTNPKAVSDENTGLPYTAVSNNIIHGGGTNSNHSKPPSVMSSNQISISSTDHPRITQSSNHNSISRHSLSTSIPPHSMPQSSSFANDLYHTTSSHSNGKGSSQTHHNPLPPSLNNSSLEWPDSPLKNLITSEHSDLEKSSDYILRSSQVSLGDTDAGSLRNISKLRHDYSFMPALSSFSSDVNKSSFLPEPKKRLFTIDDDLDLSMPSKSPKK